LNTIIRLNGEKSIRWDPDHLDSLLVDKDFRLRVQIDEDSLNFLTVLNPEIDQLTGDIHLDALLTGNYDNPQIVEGKFKVENGRLFLSKLENSIGEISLASHIEGRKLLIDNFSARSPKKVYSRNFLQKWVYAVQTFFFPQKQSGYISGQGNVDLTYLDRPKLDLNVSMNNAYFNYFLENTQIVSSSDNLHISGRDTILIEGDVVVNEADVELNFAESEKNLLLSSSARENPPFLQYDLAVDILPKFVVRSTETLNNFNMRLSGDLRITQEPRGDLEMYGVLETSGKYFIQGEDFTIQSGKIDFVNPKELPEINLVAQKQKNNLVFNLHVRGRLNAPEKELVIQDEQGNTLPYPDVKDQMALLLFGVTFNELGTNTDALLLNKGEQVVTQALVATIEKEARTFTGLDQIRLDTQDSFFKNRLNQPATLALGKYLTPKLYLEYKSRLESSSLGNIPAPSLSWEAGNQIYLQYRLNHSWSFDTIFQKTLEGNDKFNVDISWQVNF
jgi:autotransporter translocation and assembly factor TamB